MIGLCNDPEGPEQGTEQGPVRADQTAGDLFRSGSNYRRAAFLFDQGALGTTTAALCMILVMLPFFLFAMYEKNGQPLEVFLGHLIENKFIRPKTRIYQTNNLYSALVRQYELEQEVRAIAGKNGKTRKTGRGKAQADPRRA